MSILTDRDILFAVTNKRNELRAQRIDPLMAEFRARNKITFDPNVHTQRYYQISTEIAYEVAAYEQRLHNERHDAVNELVARNQVLETALQELGADPQYVVKLQAEVEMLRGANAALLGMGELNDFISTTPFDSINNQG